MTDTRLTGGLAGLRRQKRMSELQGIFTGLEFTTIALVISGLVLIHIRMYHSWQLEKEWEEERKALFADMREALKRETRDS